MNHLKNSEKISLFDKIGYGMGNYSYGIVSQAIATYIVFYATTILGISGKLVGIAVSLSVFWDAITDPLMGCFSDMTRSKIFGRRHLYILFGVIAMAVFNFLLWSINPAWTGTTKLLLIVFYLIMAKTFITVYTTPYTALGAELSNDYNERTSIQGIRTMFFLLGITSATVMGLLLFFNPTPEYPIGQENPMSYINMGLAASVVAFVFGMICFFSTIKYIPKLPKPKVEYKNIFKQLISQFTNTLTNRYYRYVVLAYLFTNISSGIFSTLGLHVYTYTFQLDNSQTSIVIGVQFAICILVQPIWVKISKKIDKKPSVMLGLIIGIISCFVFGVLVLLKAHVMGNVLYIIPFSVVSGFGIAGLFSLPLSMIADTIDVDELNSGVRSEGTYYGILTLAYKLSQAVTILLLGFLLDFAKFKPGLDMQTEQTVIILGMTLPIGSIIGFIIALICYSKYDLDAEKVADIQERIQKETKF